MLEDPYVEPGFTREPLMDEVDVAIIGGEASRPEPFCPRDRPERSYAR